MSNPSADEVDRYTVLSYASKIPWENYVGPRGKSLDAIFLEREDVEVIRKYAGLNITKSDLEESDAATYPQALMKAIMNITDVRVMQFSLTLIRDFLEVDVTRVKYLSKPGSTSSAPFVQPFLQLVGTSGSGSRVLSVDANPYILRQAAVIAAYIIAYSEPIDVTATCGTLAWILTNLKLFSNTQSRQQNVVEAAVEVSMVLLRNSYIRKLFIEEHGIERLIPLLACRNTQLLYDTLFCLWLISLDSNTSHELERVGIAHVAARLVRTTMPMKVIRLSIGLLANICRNPKCSDSLAEICETHVPGVVQTLLDTEPKIADVELLEDLKWLKDAISSNVRQLTSVERYERELRSGHLEWTTVHSESFFKDHALELEADDFALIRLLLDILRNPESDSLTVSVALHDLGEFAVHHPNGKLVLTSIGARDIIMSFLKADEDDVKHQALVACSKVLVNRWKFVSGTSVAA